MAEHPHDEHRGDEPRGGIRYGTWVFWGFALAALYFLVTEHRAHAVQFLPFLLLLACPLLHMFHGHGAHGGHGGEETRKEEKKP